MNEKIREHVMAYNKKNHRATDDETIIQIILDAKVKYSELIRKSRWWNDIFCVCEVDGMLIGYNYTEITGDDSVEDKGREFDPSSICEVIKKEETKVITTYIQK